MNKTSLLTDSHLHKYRSISSENGLLKRINSILFHVKRWFVPPNRDELIGRAALLDQRSLEGSSLDKARFISRALKFANKNIPFENDIQKLRELKGAEARIVSINGNDGVVEAVGSSYNIKIVHTNKKNNNDSFRFTSSYNNVSYKQLCDLIDGKKVEGLDPVKSEKKLTRTKVKTAWQLVKNIVSKKEEPLKLKLVLADLAELYEEVNHGILKDPESFAALNSLLRSASREMLEAFEKGKITKEERDALIPQLHVVQESLEKISEKFPSFPKIPPDSMRNYFKNPVKIGPVPIKWQDENRDPVVELPKKSVSLVKPINNEADLIKMFDGPFDVDQILAIDFDILEGEIWGDFSKSRERLVNNLNEPPKPKAKVNHFLYHLSSEGKEKIREGVGKFAKIYNNLEKNEHPDYLLAIGKLFGILQIIHPNQNEMMHGLITVMGKFDAREYRTGDALNSTRDSVVINPLYTQQLYQLKLLYLQTYNHLKSYISLYHSDAFTELFLKKSSKIEDALRYKKPLTNPFLRALFTKYSFLWRFEDHQPKIDDRRAYGMMSEEAIMDNPEAVAEFVLNRYNESLIDEGKSPENFFPAFSKEDLQTLFFMSRSIFGQIEIIDYIDKRPNLLDDQEVLNYISNLFFQDTLDETLRNNKVFKDELPKWVEQKIEQYKGDIDKYLFFIEMQEKLKIHYDLMGYKHSFKEYDVMDLPKNKSLNYIYTLNIFKKLHQRKLSPEDSKEVVEQYQYLISHPLPKNKSDPLRDELIKRRMNVLYDSLNIVERKPEWPEALLKLAQLKDLRDEKLTIDTALIEDRKIYKIQSKNRFVQVEVSPEGEIHVYRKVKGFEDLIEHIDGDKFKHQISLNLNVDIQSATNSLMEPPLFSFAKLNKIINFLKGRIEDLRPPGIPFVFRNLYVNPSEPNKFYSLNEDDEINFVLEIQGGQIRSILDKRDDTGPWQVVSGNKIDHPLIDRLGLFEDKAQILGFAKGANLERIELPRLNLQFDVVGSELKGKGEYQGYRLDFNESPILPLSLRLVPEDETKPIKIIVPKAEHISQKERGLIPFNPSFIASFVDLNIKIIQFFREFVSPRLLWKDYALSSLSHIETYTLNVNPITQEFTRGPDVIPLIQALKQAVVVQDIDLAYKIYKGLQLADRDLNKKILKEFEFIFEKSPSLAIDQFKRIVAAHLKSVLGNNKKYKHFVEQIDRRIKPEAEAVSKKRKRYQEFVPLPDNRDKLEVPPPYEPKPSPIHIGESEPLLFSSNVANNYFSITEETAPSFSLPKVEDKAQSCEKTAVDEFNGYLKDHAPKKIKVEFKHKDLLLSRLIDPKIELLDKEEQNSLKKLNELLYRSHDKEEELAILSGRKLIASETDLMLALLQNNLQSLKPDLPSNCDLDKLKAALVLYYDAKIKLHHAKLLKQSILEDADPKNIHEILVRGRKYDPMTNPELLIFEVLSFVTFRKLNAKDQLDLLNQVLKDSTALVLAPTGSGKTKLISIVRALMRANGNNLVTQKVLPTLFKQTLQQMQELLGEVLRKRVFPFRYDPRFKPTTTINGVTSSNFTILYQDLLRVIRDKGILITDYKTLPLLEEKFFSLSYELNNLKKAGFDLPALEVEHWDSLRKILILLKNNEDQMMDEFDEPNRPVHRIQMAVSGKSGEEPASFMLEESAKLYERLLDEKELYLESNLQGDIPEIEREAIIKKIAKEYAEGNSLLEKYFLGESEEVLTELDKAPEEVRDRAAFLKDQFTVFLPLCLSNSHISRYKRSSNGMRLMPCELGTPHDAKFGNIVEEINYTIQEYKQSGVHPGEITVWLKNIKNDQETFEKVFKGLNVSTPVDQLVEVANADANIQNYFLERALKRLKVNGAVVSMNPHNAVSMAKVVSGVSATMGDPDALSSAFTYDSDEIGSVQAEMAYRFMERVKENESLLEYDPADPLKLIKDSPQHDALIDGAGAFKEVDPSEVGEAFNSGYHDEKGDIVDAEKEKFYFAQSYTRGTDRKFKPKAKALLTANGKGTLEQLNQQEGRMRLEGQKVRIARSKFNPELKNVRDVLQSKVRFQARKRAKDLYDSKKLEADNVIRSELKMKLLPIEDINAYLDEFDGVQKEFITEPSTNYKTPGSYYDKHKHLIISDSDPIAELDAYREKQIQKAKNLKLDAAVEKLKNTSYPDELRNKLMDKVASRAPETEIEVELEEELEMEQEQEQELELDTQKLRNEDRIYFGRKVATGPRAVEIHKAFDYRIDLEGRFQPKEGQYAGARQIFSSSMFRVNHIQVRKSHNTYWIHIEDRIAFTDSSHHYLGDGFIYDIDRDQVLETIKTTQVDLDNDDLHHLFAQVKFIDGRIEGYKEKELLMLKKWLLANKPKELLNFLLNTILRNREVDKDRFPGSQLGKLFESIVK